MTISNTVMTGNTVHPGSAAWTVPAGTAMDWPIRTQVHPYTCPVCSGRGYHAPGFYALTEQERARIVEQALTQALDNETCRSCSASGVLWR
jgi:hypothetical protein